MPNRLYIERPVIKYIVLRKVCGAKLFSLKALPYTTKQNHVFFTLFYQKAFAITLGHIDYYEVFSRIRNLPGCNWNKYHISNQSERRISRLNTRFICYLGKQYLTIFYRLLVIGFQNRVLKIQQPRRKYLWNDIPMEKVYLQQFIQLNNASAQKLQFEKGQRVDFKRNSLDRQVDYVNCLFLTRTLSVFHNGFMR